MGNCLMTKKILAQDEEDEAQRCAEVMEGTKSATSSTLGAVRPIGGGKAKTVRFRTLEGDADDRERCGKTKGGVVRIRLVVTQNELCHILNTESKYTSVEQLLGAMKLSSSRRVSHQGRTSDEGMSSTWKPALESIPEDR
ncbi:unnamed protein product [Ilex paraguariensis]|uniref:Uncharacterized protein n=1 Tax=Ilex paraguariensis TaxID=185542 RepID=A0ABC8SQ13_9AQUA